MADAMNLTRLAAEIDEAGYEWQAGETALTALTPEQQRLHLGLDVPPGEPERIEAALAAAAAYPDETAGAGAPRAHDWRSVGGRNVMSPIKDQGNCGSCVAFATVATIEAQARIEHDAPDWALDLSEADLFYCGAGRRCSQGWWPVEALAYARQKGVSEEACFPYVAGDRDCAVCADKADRMLKVGQGPEIIPIAERKRHLAERGPLIACFAVHQDFMAYRGGAVYRKLPNSPLLGYHAVCCVGYDDDQRCWIAKNSWGTNWGEQGYFRIGYGECEIDTRFAMYGALQVTGTLRPDTGETEETGVADYVALEDDARNGGVVIFAHVKGAWRHLPVPVSHASSLVEATYQASTVDVSFKGEEITHLRPVKQLA